MTHCEIHSVTLLAVRMRWEWRGSFAKAPTKLKEQVVPQILKLSLGESWELDYKKCD